jgi:hypothetical protein
MDEMMRRTGAADEVIGNLEKVHDYRAIALRCLACRHGSGCALWLDASERRSAAPAFCPNREALEALSGPHRYGGPSGDLPAT